MAKTMVAIADQVICERHEKALTDAGIIIPDSAKKQNRATVLSAGTECKWVKPGDTILLLRGGTQIAHDGKDYEIVRERADYFIILGK